MQEKEFYLEDYIKGYDSSEVNDAQGGAPEQSYINNSTFTHKHYKNTKQPNSGRKVYPILSPNDLRFL